MTELLIKTIKAITYLPPEEEEKLIDKLQLKVLHKNDCFIKEGQVPKRMAFINKGLFRYYYIDEKGAEFTKGFFAAGSFLSSYTAMLQQSASKFAIEALKASELLVFEYTDWKILLEQHICWNKLLIAILEKAFAKKEKRERDFVLLDAEARYIDFLEENPGVEHTIKQHMIASYLGITPVALSRIRKKMGLVNIG